jgi:methylglyoxal synthase
VIFVNIALTAHDRKKELMVQFCIAYCGILAGHSICATATTGRLVSEATGLPIKLYLSAAQGGVQQIEAQIAYNELDLVLFFCDPTYAEIGKGSVNAIARLCDRYSVPFASNVATAEVLIQGLKRGDLDWRDIVNPKK